MSGQGSGLGPPPGLRLRNEQSGRLLRTPAEAIALAEESPGQWAAPRSMGWEQWRQLALLILRTDDPGPGGTR